MRFLKNQPYFDLIKRNIDYRPEEDVKDTSVKDVSRSWAPKRIDNVLIKLYICFYVKLNTID